MPHKTSDGTYRFIFYASDWGQPPHVHVQREHRVGKFWLDPVRLETSGAFEPSETLRIARILERYQAFLMESWREYFSRELGAPGVERVIVTEDALTAELSDGRTISVPLDWYPRLAHATPQERDNWELIGSGEGIHWPDLDEDISVDGAHRRQAVRRGREVLPAVAQGEARGPPAGVLLVPSVTTASRRTADGGTPQAHDRDGAYPERPRCRAEPADARRGRAARRDALGGSALRAAPDE